MIKRKKNMLFLLSLTTVILSFSTAVFAEEKVDNITTTTSAVQSTTSAVAQVVTQPTSAKFKGDGYEVEFKLNSQYAGGFLGEFVVTNTGNKLLENWAIKCDIPHDIVSIWNGKILSHEGTTYIIKNAEWNQDIPVGGSASVGIGGKCTDKVTLPEKCQVLIGKRVLKPEEYSSDFNIRSDWGESFVGDFTITNKTNKPIEDWILEFDFDKDISYIWGLEILKHEGSHYVIKNSGYNQNIKPGQTITLGFQGTPGNVTTKPSNYKMTELLQDDYSPVDSDNNDTPTNPVNPGAPTIPPGTIDQGNGDYVFLAPL